mmetsp:Transcript_32034/g.66879  ORF Transcript_32034/g.66879 Transcript_32034/m.66879 type:complete len:510 (-) Transcript_32034:58-1587(-)
MRDDNNGNASEDQGTSRPSLLSGLHRPTLSGRAGRSDDNIRTDFEETLTIPARPRRLWKVSDTGIPSIPPFYPLPLDPRCCAYVADASPSVVSVRVAEALRRQSIAVEYDDETVTATCMTVDRCRFMIHLWKAKSPMNNSTTAMSASLDGTPSSTVQRPESESGLIVECKRVSGDVISFHSAVSAIKKAAKSHGTGKDGRKTYQTSPLEYPRFVTAGATDKNPTPSPDPAMPSPAAIEGIEHAIQLLKKDRLDAQLRGMEQIVALTDAVSSGLDIAFTTAAAVIGSPLGGSDSYEDDVPAAQTLHQDWIYSLLVYRELPDEIRGGPSAVDEITEEHRATALAFICGFGGDHDAGKLNDKQIEQMREERVRMGDDYHGDKLRSMALRALTNSLGLLSRHNPRFLYTTLSTQSPHLMSEDLFRALWMDTAGASRPPGIVFGTRLASPHEAALAVRCIRLLGQAHPRAKQRLVKDKKGALEQLEKAYFVGQANHELLEFEAKRTYRFLTAHT